MGGATGQGRQERIALNENAYRELNESIHSGSTPQRRFELLCECGSPDCTRPLTATLEEYEAVRADPRRFMVLPGHQILDAEGVVEEHEGFNVVEKPEDVAHIVEAGDPRRADR